MKCDVEPAQAWTQTSPQVQQLLVCLCSFSEHVVFFVGFSGHVLSLEFRHVQPRVAFYTRFCFGSYQQYYLCSSADQHLLECIDFHGEKWACGDSSMRRHEVQAKVSECAGKLSTRQEHQHTYLSMSCVASL